MSKKLISLFLTVILILTMVPTAFAADLMEDSRFYSDQQRSRTCTLAAATMMLRRRAYLDGDENFAGIVESSVRKVGWWDGLSHDFTYNGMTIDYATLPRDWEEREALLIALLAEHPEGIVAYDRSSPHAVLLTDYTDGVFYCSDPARNLPTERITIDQASIDLRSIQCYWYIVTDTNEPYGTMAVDELTLSGLFYPANVQVGTNFELGGLLRCDEGSAITQVALYLLDTDGNILQHAALQPLESSSEWSFRALNEYIRFGELTEGRYIFYFAGMDSTGATITFNHRFNVSAEVTETLYHWSNKPGIKPSEQNN